MAKRKIVWTETAAKQRREILNAGQRGIKAQLMQKN